MSYGVIGIDSAWVIPALCAAAFFFIVAFMRLFPPSTPLAKHTPNLSAATSILAILLGFILFWFVLADLLNNGPGALSINWLTIGDTILTWGVVVDNLSVVMLGLVTFVALLVQVYSLGYMKGDPRFGWYFGAHSLFAGAMLALVLADNLLFLYIAWELVGLGSYLLIGFRYEKRSAAEAAKKAFVTTRIGDVGLLIGIILLFKATGTFELSAIFHAAEAGGISQSTLNASALLILMGAMGKSAQFPFHVWLPDAMEGPTPVSALIHAATMVAAGVYLVARMMPIFELAPTVLLIVAIIGLITFTFASTVALVVTDFKRVLAYSTISHLGLMMLSLGAGAVGAALLHLVAHGVSKALLFLGAGSVMHGTGGKTEIWEMGGLRKAMPITAVTFLIGAGSLAGIPPLGGFFSKDEVLLSVWDHRNPVFLVLTLAAVGLSALYMARVTFVVFFGKPRNSDIHAHESQPVMWVPLALLALLAAGVGFLAFSWTDSYRGFVGFLEPDEGFHFVAWLTVLSALLALVGVGMAWLAYIRGAISPQRISTRFATIHRILVHKYYVDDLYQWAIDRVVLVFGRFIALFDRIVINDTGVNGPGIAVKLSALRLRYAQSGWLYTYGLFMAFGFVALALIWWLVLA
ncbi:MAG: NADH-quinone oxidoreductase subunit L [SAR202 cluster bacterium]|nr:NADH-quinone oxidoreductase subunit L [SAR202 cluster bacterium]